MGDLVDMKTGKTQAKTKSGINIRDLERHFHNKQYRVALELIDLAMDRFTEPDGDYMSDFDPDGCTQTLIYAPVAVLVSDDNLQRTHGEDPLKWLLAEVEKAFYRLTDEHKRMKLIAARRGSFRSTDKPDA